MRHRIWVLAYGAAALAGGALLWQIGCRAEVEPDETPLLAEAPAGESNFSSYAPKNPYKEVAPNLLARTLFEAAGPGGVRIEIRDLFILPGKTAENVTLPGPATFEVLSGEGRMTTGDKSQDLRIGATLSVPQGASFSLESKDTTPLIVRARVFAP
jgi:quercetin dioxygenase-like cupin family protein